MVVRQVPQQSLSHRRTRASAKKAGASFERLVADFLCRFLRDDRVDRRVKRGVKDRGDIHGVRTVGGGRVVVECKDYGGQIMAGPWLAEAGAERGNDDAVVGVVVAKRRGTTVPGEQIVMMTLLDFALLLEGGSAS
jgi:hypothetical protein